MPSNKIIIVFIASLAIVTSIWLLTREKTVGDMPAVTTGNPRQYIEAGDDWQNILTEIEQTELDSVSVLTTGEGDAGNDTTITSKISKDFLSQYLMTIQKNGTVTQSDIDNIAKNILAVSDYTQTKGAVYIPGNLIIVNKNDRTSFIVYKNTINRLLRESSTQVKDDPMAITLSAMENESENELKKLDPMIVIAKKLIADLLNVETPSTAVSQHLKLLNTFSRILASLESMRESVEDPIKGLSGIVQYQKLITTDLNSAIQAMNGLFILKTGSAT